MSVIFSQLETFDARAEDMDVQWISTYVMESHPQLDLQCVGPFVQDLLSALVQCIGNSGNSNFWSCFIQKLPAIVVDFLKCQFGFSQQQAQATAMSCILALVGNLISGVQLREAVAKFFLCLATSGGGNGGGGNGGGGNGGGEDPPPGTTGPANRKVSRC